MATDNVRLGATPSGIAYIACGPSSSTTALICIPGWTCRAEDFRPFLEALATQAPSIQAFSIDLPGHDRSPISLAPDGTIESYATLVLSFAREMNLSSIIIVGHSLGCRVAIEAWNQAAAATSQKQNIKSLVFIDGSHYRLRGTTAPFDERDSRSAALSSTQKIDLIATFFAKMFSEETPSSFRDAATAHVHSMNEAHNLTERKALLDYDFDKLDGALEAFGRDDSGCGLLCLQSTGIDPGTNQRVFLKEGDVSDWMAHVRDLIPHVRLEVVPTGGHFPHVDRPGEVVGKILDFAGSLGSKRRITLLMV